MNTSRGASAPFFVWSAFQLNPLLTKGVQYITHIKMLLDYFGRIIHTFVSYAVNLYTN